MASDERIEKIRRVVAARQSGFVVVLEDIEDPYNAQAVFRTCDAFGVQDVYMIFDRISGYDPVKAGKSSSTSANKWVTIRTFHSTQACMKSLREDGYTVYATVAADDAEVQAIYDIDFSHEKIAVLFGNERNGLSETALHAADIKLTIPMRGMMRSLNISVSAAICIFEATRQRQSSGRSFQLPEQKQLELMDDLLHRKRKFRPKIKKRTRKYRHFQDEDDSAL